MFAVLKIVWYNININILKFKKWGIFYVKKMAKRFFKNTK